jgi:prolyl-tRNA synthetase
MAEQKQNQNQNQKPRTAISPTREENYPEWYLEVVKAADLAETSPVRGCMVIKPWGFELWQNIQATLDKAFKATGHSNAYFPLFIPLSFLAKEAEHVEGFAKECAVVTHHRLEAQDGKLVPAGELEEPLVVRPTSETIIGAQFAKWVQSYRDLPLLINQWANVVRWEMRTRLFLRTMEFLWQEGHTAHETEKEAIEETERMLEVYRRFAEEHMALPVLVGEKTDSQRFPGAVKTLCFEAMMQDRKSLQAGTSHFLGQNFAKSSGIQFQSREGKEEFAWTTSWGVSTRLIGALIMAHADDDGMVVPPRLAPSHVVILPIIRDEKDKETILAYCNSLADSVRTLTYAGRQIEVIVDKRDINAGERSWQWVKKGIPIRCEIGMRDIEKNGVYFGRRDKPVKEKSAMTRDEFTTALPGILEDIQKNLFERALSRLKENTLEIDGWEKFKAWFTPKNADRPEIHGGFAMSHWCGDAACETKTQDELAVTIRLVPFDRAKSGPGQCVVCGKPSAGRVVFAKSY